MKHQLDYLLNREETTQRQVSKELQIKMCACERGYPHTLTHVLTRCLLNFTSVCKTTTASVCTARPLCIPKMRPRPRAWLPGDRPPHPRCSLEAPIAVAERVQAQTERCLIKEGWLPRDFPPGGVGVLSYLPLGDWRVRAAKERRWRGEEGILGRPRGGNRWKHNQALLRGLSASRAAPGRPAPGVRGLEAGSALGGGSLPVRAAPRGAEEAPRARPGTRRRRALIPLHQHQPRGEVTSFQGGFAAPPEPPPLKG